MLRLVRSGATSLHKRQVSRRASSPDIPPFDQRQRCPAGHDGRVFDVAFSCARVSPTLASASDDNTVRVWNVSSADQRLQQSTSCSGHQDSVLRVNWNNSGTMLASGTACHRSDAISQFGSHRTHGLQLLLTPPCSSGSLLMRMRSIHQHVCKARLSRLCRCLYTM